MIEQYDLDRHEWEVLIDRWVFDEITREMLKRKLLDGVTFEKLAEEFDVSTKTAQNRIYKGVAIMAKHIKDKNYSKLWRLSFVRPSAEDRQTLYVCFFGKRYLFTDGKYRGWYHP